MMRVALVTFAALLAVTTAAAAQDSTRSKPAAKPMGPRAVVLQTTLGDIVIKLRPDAAPKTVASFVGLARGLRPFQDPTSGKWVKRPFYDGLDMDSDYYLEFSRDPTADEMRQLQAAPA